MNLPPLNHHRSPAEDIYEKYHSFPPPIDLERVGLERGFEYIKKWLENMEICCEEAGLTLEARKLHHSMRSLKGAISIEILAQCSTIIIRNCITFRRWFGVRSRKEVYRSSSVIK